MRTLTCTKPGNFEYGLSDRPALKKDHAIVRISHVGICGTDLHAYEGIQPFFQYPRILGHELSGELVESDGAPGFGAGEQVAILPYFHCGNCIACRIGKPNCCVSLKVCGIHIDGGMREYLSVPSYALIHGEGLTPEELALVEPLAIGAHGVRRAVIQPGEFVLVIGAGPIGLGTMEFVKIAGGRVIAMDINENRLRFCRDTLGVRYTIHAGSEDPVGKLKEITNGDMPTLVIDATGNLQAINRAFEFLAHGGRYILIGLQKGDIRVSHPEFHKREATLMSSRNATRQDFEQVMDAIKNGAVNANNYITHRVPFEMVKTEFEKWLKPETGVIKAMVHF